VEASAGRGVEQPQDALPAPGVRRRTRHQERAAQGAGQGTRHRAEAEDRRGPQGQAEAARPDEEAARGQSRSASQPQPLLDSLFFPALSTVSPELDTLSPPINMRGS